MTAWRKQMHLPVTVVLHHGRQLVEYIPLVPTKAGKGPSLLIGPNVLRKACFA
jgi:hypothetical protein